MNCNLKPSSRSKTAFARNKALSLLACFFILTLCPVSAVQEINTDLCVYGGTSGGVIAAVQAARMGKSVALVVVNNHLGGMTSGGLGQTDIGGRGDAYIQGVAREFYTRVGQKYGTGAKFTFEPHLAETVFNEMASLPGLTIYTNQHLDSVIKNGQQILAASMNNGNLFRAKVFIDASYEGDLMAGAKVGFTIGRESVSQHGENLNGIRAANTGGHQFGSRKVDPYMVPGLPASGLLPLIAAGNPGTTGNSDQRVQAYNFRMCLTTQATNKVPISAPAHYDPAQYELLGRYIQSLVDGGTTPSLGTFMNISSMPNGKTDINNNGPVSTDFIGQSDAYTTADFVTRAQIWQSHKDYLQGFLYFLATDSRVPSAVRTSISNYGLCRDEFADNSGWPYQLYVREARRMISDYIITQANCLGQVVTPDSVGLGAYAMDSHNCQRVVVDGCVQNEGDTYPVAGIPGVYPISYRSLIPKASECTNLLVPWCLSASHIAFCSIRMEPVFMILGQSAATAACFAIDDEVAVQNVNISKLQAQLIADQQKLQVNTVSGPSVDVISLLLDFGPTAVSTSTDKLNDPAHGAGGLANTQANWNTGLTNDSASLVFSDGTTAAGVSIDLGRSDAGVTGTVNFDNNALSTILGSSSLTTGIYAGNSPMKDGVFANGGYPNQTTNLLGLKISGLAAGSYTVFVAARNCNISSSGTNGQDPTLIYYAQGSGATSYNFTSAPSRSQSNTNNPFNTSSFVQGDNYAALTMTLTSGNSIYIGVAGSGYDDRGFLNAVCVMPVSAIPSQTVNLWTTDAQAFRSGPQPGSFTLSRSGNLIAPLAVNLNIGGTASNGVDYPYLANAITIPAGRDHLSIPIVPYTLLPVGDKTLILSLGPAPSYSTGNQAAATIIIHDKPIYEWRTRYFGNNATNAAIAGDTANPAGDGVPNLMKYAFGVDPLRSTRKPLVWPAINPEGTFALSYTRPDPPPADISYLVERSDDLITWHTNACTNGPMTFNPDCTATVTCGSLVPVTSAPKQFMRLKVSETGATIQGVKVVAFGDSITYGYGVPSATNWVNQLASRFSLNMVNAGVSGNTSLQGLGRIQSDVLDKKPDFVLINFGMNDHVMTASNAPKVDLLTFRNNLIEMVDRTRTNNAIPILMTVNYLIEGDSSHYYYGRHPASYYEGVGGAQAWLDAYIQVVRDVATQKHADLVDVRAASENYNRYDFLQSLTNGANVDDGVHPYLIGSAVYAKTIGDYLASHYINVSQ